MVLEFFYIYISLYIRYLLLTAASYCLQRNLEFTTGISAGNVLIPELWAEGYQPLVKLAYTKTILERQHLFTQCFVHTSRNVIIK